MSELSILERRIEILERENAQLTKDLKQEQLATLDLRELIKHLEAENARLRKALTRIADRDYWGGIIPGKGADTIARSALEENTKEG